MFDCKHRKIETRLYIKPRGMIIDGNFGLNVVAYSAIAYAVCEVICLDCKQEIDRRSIEVKPSDIEIPLPPSLKDNYLWSPKNETH